ncbi:helix-turn-helix transcriptional regulator [Oscillochloris sp. ZM17-4]|uniref:helix-turn-helix transcriptional regulator n=1 Tax=Oscillochloris sp. ZM17-4 TaxID=2866714 RepID=UPI001C73CD9F|nr:helix-turn-helix transcriptional regulator [Oscillochloris sp. ZM17-4]MBX0328230.1 helix-turn-helix transcriptional regulator [Oscillochloris sp. ZM17-4]
MSMTHVGMYLRLLREWNSLSQEDVAQALEVSSKQVARWERGESDPSAVSLMMFVNTVQGDIRHVKSLMEEMRTLEDSQDMAAQRIEEIRRIGSDPESLDSETQIFKLMREYADIGKKSILDRVAQYFRFLDHEEKNKTS